jgi:Uma2 family endonuclease
MTAVEAPPRTEDTLADLLERIGSVPLNRIPSRPAPGTATEADVLALHDHENRLFELVEGVLVEKAMGYYESVLAGVLIHLLHAFLEEHDLGVVAGEGGMLRLAPGLVRIPDVSFVSWDQIPGREIPKEPIPDLAPDLAVEVLSTGNTEPEMALKVREYFDAGCRLVWLVEPESRTARAFTHPERFSTVAADGELDGGDVIPGFRLSLDDWFRRANRRQSRR